MTATAIDLRPMLCKQESEFPLDNAWVIEPKLDGWRWLAHVTEQGVRSYGGRNATDHTGEAAGVEGALAALPPVLLDGELIAFGKGLTSSDVSSVLAHPDSGQLVYVVFDVLEVLGNDVRGLPWESRRELLEGSGVGSVQPAALPYAPVVLSRPVAPSLKQHEAWIEAGFEGSVAKRRDSVYVPGKRGWIKVKPQTTDEAVITGFKVSDSATYNGLVTSFELRMLTDNGLGAETSCGCKDDAQIADVNAEGGSARYLGKVIEIRHHGLSKTGVPRHPVFARMRPDRDVPA